MREVLVADGGAGFLDDFSEFHKPIAGAGMLNSLAQTLIKMTAPGVPDFYQGTELWDLNLVDPDNRRPVDFGKRRNFLEEFKREESVDRAGMVCDMLSQWQDGRVKLYLIYKILTFRREHRALFQSGDYLPLYADGKFREHICAFARRFDGRWVIVAAPRLMMRLVDSGCLPLGAATWQQERLALPSNTPARWRNILTGEILTTTQAKAGRNALLLREILASFPVALLSSEPRADA